MLPTNSILILRERVSCRPLHAPIPVPNATDSILVPMSARILTKRARAFDTYRPFHRLTVKVDGTLLLARLIRLDLDLFPRILAVETHVDVDWRREGEERRHFGLDTVACR